MKLLAQNSTFVDLKPLETFLLAFLVESRTLRTTRVDDRSAIDRLLLVSMKMPRREQLEPVRDRRSGDVSLLPEVALETFDRIMSQENVHFRRSVKLLSHQRILIRPQTGVEAHSCNVDCFGSKVEHLRSRNRVLEKVDVTSLSMNRQRRDSLLYASGRVMVAADQNHFDL